MPELAIGIDLGTSNSCVAVATGSGIRVLPNNQNENISASVVALHENGAITTILTSTIMSSSAGIRLP